MSLLGGSLYTLLPPCHGGRKKVKEKTQLWLLHALSFGDLSSPVDPVEQDSEVKTWVLESDRPGFKSHFWHL